MKKRSKHKLRKIRKLNKMLQKAQLDAKEYFKVHKGEISSILQKGGFSSEEIPIELEIMESALLSEVVVKVTKFFHEKVTQILEEKKEALGLKR